MFVALCFAVAAGRRREFAGSLGFVKGSEHLFRFDVAFADLLLIVCISRACLAQGEKMLGLPVALEAAFDGASVGLDAMVAVFG